MLVNFHIDRLDRLLLDFYRLTGLTVSIWDAEFNQLSYQPKEMCGFCRLVKSSPEGARRCYLSDKRLCMESATISQPVLKGMELLKRPISCSAQVMAAILA